MEWDIVETFDAADESTMPCESFAPCEDDEAIECVFNVQIAQRNAM